MFKCCSGHFFVLNANKKGVSFAGMRKRRESGSHGCIYTVCGQQHRTASKQHEGMPHQSHDLGATVIAADACRGVD
jgi:hypothetical protein